jgi:hypothetical protein
MVRVGVRVRVTHDDRKHPFSLILSALVQYMKTPARVNSEGSHAPR